MPSSTTSTSSTSWFQRDRVGPQPTTTTIIINNNNNSRFSTKQQHQALSSTSIGSSSRKEARGGSSSATTDDHDNMWLHQTIASCLHPQPHIPPGLAASASRAPLRAGSSSTSHSGGYGTGGGGAGAAATFVTGLSPLVLEHGERVLLDWAVVVSSSPVGGGDAGTAAESAAARRSGGRDGGGGGVTSCPGEGPHGPIQWAQAPEAVQHYRNIHPTSASNSPARSTTNPTRSRRTSRAGTNSHAVNATTDKDAYPSCHLSRLEGRLHLCSKSLVIEPHDPTKPLWRCPFARMSVPPKEDPLLRQEGFESVAAEFVVSRHFAIPPGGTAPFDVIHIPTRFVVTFLHSSPSALVTACDQLLSTPQRDHHHRSGTGRDTTTTTSTTTNHTNPNTIVIRSRDRPLDPEHLLDLREHIAAQFQCQLLAPLQEVPGVLALTPERLYFQPSVWAIASGGDNRSKITPNDNDHFDGEDGPMSVSASDTSTTKVGKWSKTHIVALARRYHGLRDCAIEIFFAPPAWETTPSLSSATAIQGSSLLLALRGRHDREQLVRHLERVGIAAGGTATTISIVPRPLGRGSSNRQPPPLCLTSREFVARAFDAWHQGNLSNFDYLLVLNSAAGRSYHDLSRYPVFPWVIRDYESPKLDLTKESTFRDLTKPVGALNPQRLEYFRQRMQSMHDMGDEFLYGTHYSAPGYVLYYLVRTMPEHMLCLQNGKFDAPDRMFHSLAQCFQCVMTNHADVKEVLPQFYHPAHFDFLLNARGLQLGATQTGERVDDVVLPPWAKSARDFVRKNRQALESPWCTERLPRWIDLIFGCASRGNAARDADNLFHSSAYLSPTDLASKSEDERAQAELHATEFGIVPDQLFVGPHPRRGDETGGGSNGDHPFLADIGRASASDADLSQSVGGTGGGGGGGAWELLDKPIPSEDDGRRVDAPVPETSRAEPWPRNEPAELSGPSFGFASEEDATNLSSSVPLRGKGEATSHQSRRDFRPPPVGSDDRGDGSTLHRPQPPSPVRTLADAPASEWDMKILERKHIHADAVSGCALWLEGDAKPSLLATTSLDGGLKVHRLSLGPSEDEPERKGFPTTLSRFSYSTILSRAGPAGQPPSAPSKLTEYRSHTSRDPLASLVLATDGESGRVAFAGGHDDVVLAYGINSACAVASIYSHRDAVTGLDLIPRTPSDPECALWLEKSTHIMVSGSWDATVKVWSAIVSGGEAVAINREPLAELFDADSSIVSVTAKASPTGGIVIGAGCADGGFCVWTVHNDGMQVMVHKEAPRRGSGPCSVVKWVSDGIGQLSLFAAFSTGVVSSYALVEGALQRLSAVSIGVAVLSLVHAGGHLWVGSADGALRLIPLREGGYFDKPTLWPAANHKSSPGISSISVTSLGPTTTAGLTVSEDSFLCCTGGEDGSVALFEIHRRTSTR